MTITAQARSVLITGVGNPGNLPHALLQVFANRGDTIYAVGRKLSDVEALLSDLREKGATAHAFAAELTNVDEVKNPDGSDEQPDRRQA